MIVTQHRLRFRATESPPAMTNPISKTAIMKRRIPLTKKEVRELQASASVTIGGKVKIYILTEYDHLGN